MQFWHSLPPIVRLLFVLLLAVQFTPVIRLYAAYVVVPQVLYRTSIIEEDVTRAVAPAAGDIVEPRMLAWVDEMERSLLGLGFSDSFRTTHQADRVVTALGSHLEQNPRGDLASIVSLRNQALPADAPLVNSVTFESHFEDGAELVTSNDNSPRLWPYPPRCRVVRLEGETDVAEIYRLHRLRVAAHARRSAKKPLTRGLTSADRLEHARRETRAFYDHLVSCGYRRRTPEGLRPTVRGAAFTTWRRLAPWRQLREWEERRLEAAVRRLG